MFCSECGSALSDSAKFCSKCGKATEEAADSSEAVMKKLECPGCGSNVQATDKKCGRCSALLTYSPKKGISGKSGVACRICGHETLIGQNACVECEMPLDDEGLKKIQAKRIIEQNKVWDFLGEVVTAKIKEKSRVIVYTVMAEKEEVLYVVTENRFFTVVDKSGIFSSKPKQEIRDDISFSSITSISSLQMSNSARYFFDIATEKATQTFWDYVRVNDKMGQFVLKLQEAYKKHEQGVTLPLVNLVTLKT